MKKPHYGRSHVCLSLFLAWSIALDISWIRKKDSIKSCLALAWRIPGMGEPGGLPSMGSHRVGHDWSDLAAAYCTLVILNTHTRTYLNRKFSYPTVNAAEAWLNWKPPEPEGWAEAAGVLGLAPNVNTPDGLLLVKLKFVAVLLPNWKMEPEIVEAEKPH